MERLDTAITDICNWLAYHPRLTTVFVCSVILAAFNFAGTV